MATEFNGRQLMTTEYNSDLHVMSPFLSPLNEASCSPWFQCSLTSFCQSILLDTPRRPSVAVTVMCLGTSHMGTHRHTGQPAWSLHSLGTLEMPKNLGESSISTVNWIWDLHAPQQLHSPLDKDPWDQMIKCALCFTESKFKSHSHTPWTPLRLTF